MAFEKSLKIRAALLLVLIVLAGNGPAWAYFKCAEENWGGACSTLCIIYDDVTNEPTGWIQGPFHDC